MELITGKKIFVLYPDSRLREKIFYGKLRDRFEIYYIYDYEKIRLLAEYFPGYILCLNLVENDLIWLPNEISNELSDLPSDKKPKVIALHGVNEAESESCDRSIAVGENYREVRQMLKLAFDEYGGKGRRNFVRYGGITDSIAGIEIDFFGKRLSGTVHDISSSGLSCSFLQEPDIPVSRSLELRLNLSGGSLDCEAVKIHERNFDGHTIHIFKFGNNLPKTKVNEIYQFIHISLDAKMAQFIKKLSN